MKAFLMALFIVATTFAYAEDSRTLTISSIESKPDSEFTKQCKQLIEDLKTKGKNVASKLGLNQDDDFFIDQKNSGVLEESRMISSYPVPSWYDAGSCIATIESKNPKVTFVDAKNRLLLAKTPYEILHQCKQEMENLLAHTDALNARIVAGKHFLGQYYCYVSTLELTVTE